MPTIIELNKETGEGLAFDFPTGWEVSKYDQDEASNSNRVAGFYRRIIEGNGVKHVRGMDIVCRLPAKPEQLQFIEVKDDRKRTTEAGIRHNELYETVLRKTIGTLAGLMLAERLGDTSLRPVACLSQHPAIEVILFLIEPPFVAVPDVGSRRALRRMVRLERKTTLDQRLTAKLNQWGLMFKLYNMSDRPAPDWQGRDLS